MRAAVFAVTCCSGPGSDTCHKSRKEDGDVWALFGYPQDFRCVDVFCNNASLFRLCHSNAYGGTAKEWFDLENEAWFTQEAK